MLAVTSLSVTANALRDFLTSQISDLDGVLIGHPKEASDAIGSEGKQYLNLFFYQVEHGAYPADGDARDPFYLRVNCLVSPFGSKETGPPETSISAGENDLRLIGEVLRLFHAEPQLEISDGDERGLLQLYLLPLSLSDINHVWSTQGDVPYRLSVAYQLSLVPVPLAQARQRGPRVSAVGLAVRSDPQLPAMPAAGFGIAPYRPTLPRLEVAVAQPDWAPKIAFLDNEGRLLHSLALEAAALPPSVNVVAAGEPGAALELVWESWLKEGEPRTWQATGAPFPTAAGRAAIGPDDADLAALAVAVPLPAIGAGQLLLHARRTWSRPDGVTVTLHSNPLLAVIEEAP